MLDEGQADRIIAVYVALEKIIRERETRRANEGGAAAGAAASHGRQDD